MCDLSSRRRWTDTCKFRGEGVCGGHDQKTLADAGTSAFASGPDTFRQRPPHTTTDGNDLPTKAGGTGPIFNGRLGNAVTQLVSSGHSHGGRHCPTRTFVRLHRGVFFVRRVDPYYGAMPDTRRVVSILAYGMGGGTQRRQVHSGTGSPTKPPGPSDGKRRLIQGEGLVARISNDYRPHLPFVEKDIPESAVPYYVGIARLEESANTRMRPVGRVVRRPYPDSEESDDDVVYTAIQDQPKE